MSLTAPLFTLPVFGKDISGRDLILLLGGLFLIAKSTWEIHDKLEGEEHGKDAASRGANFASIIVQIMALDIVFSLDSVITAVGMAQHVQIMITAWSSP
jgi:predicted tellurium resistance membrane protein TerC